MAGEPPLRESRMAAMRRLPQCDRRTHLTPDRQTPGRDEGIIQGIHSQSGNPNPLKVRLGRSPCPVIVCALEAMQWRSKDIVKRMQILGCQ